MTAFFRRFSGLPGVLAILALQFTLTFFVSCSLFAHETSEERVEGHSFRTASGVEYFAEYGRGKNIRDSTGRVLSRNEADSVIVEALYLSSQFDLEHHSLGEESLGNRWREMNSQLTWTLSGFPDNQKEVYWFWILDRKLFELYDERNKLLGRMGPEGFRPPTHISAGFDSTWHSALEYRYFSSDWKAGLSLIRDRSGLYEIDWFTPAGRRLREPVEGYLSVMRFDRPSTLIERTEQKRRFSAYVFPDSVAIYADDEIHSILKLPKHLHQTSETRPWLQIDLSDSLDTLLVKGETWYLVNRRSGEWKDLPREPKKIRNEESNVDFFFKKLRLWARIYPAPIPATAVAINYMKLKYPDNYREFVEGFTTMEQKYRVSSRRILYDALLAHLFGALIGFLAAYRADRGREALVFWTATGLLTASGILGILLFRGPRKKGVRCPICGAKRPTPPACTRCGRTEVVAPVFQEG